MSKNELIAPWKRSERERNEQLLDTHHEEERGGKRGSRRGGSGEAEEQWQAEKGTAVVVN